MPRDLLADKTKQPRDLLNEGSLGDSVFAYGQPPEGMVYDPATGQMVDTKAIAEQQNKGAMGTAATAGTVALSGAPFVGAWLDEGMGKVAELAGQNPEIATAIARERIKQFEEANPKTSLGLKLGGGAAALMPLAAALPALAPATLGGRMMAGGVGGGVGGGIEGAVSGYGAGETPEERLAMAKTGAKVGGGLGLVVGAGAPLVYEAGKAGARKIVDALTKAPKAKGISQPATEVLTRAMDADGSLSGAGARRMAAAGEDAMLADAGNNARTLLDTAIQKSGPAGVAAREAIERRAGNANQRIVRALDDSLGTPRGVRTTARGIATDSAEARRMAYEVAYMQPIDYAAATGRKIEEVISRVPGRVMKQAVDNANEAMQAAGKRNMQILADIADDGTITFREMPNVQQLDEIKRALGTIGSESIDQFGRKTAAGVRASGLARQLRDAISDAVPGYKEALKLGGDKIAEDNALDLGAKLFRPGTTREMVAEATQGMTVAERRAAAQGIRSHIDEALANVKRAVTDGNMDAREAVRAVKDFSSRANREKLAMVIGEDQAEALLGQIDSAAMALDLRAGVADNSRTFARLAMDDVVKAQTEGSAWQALKSGEPVNATKRIIQAFTGSTPGAKQAVGDQVYSDIVRALVRQGPDAQAALSALETVARTSPRNALLAQEIARRITAGTAIGAYQTGTQLAGGR